MFIRNMASIAMESTFTVVERNPVLEAGGTTDDGYHTQEELYEHRTALFSVICNLKPKLAWKSKKHHSEDKDPMYKGYFIAGIITPDGDYTYHCELKYWDWFNVKELPQAPKFDGHQPSDYPRLFKLLKEGK